MTCRSEKTQRMEAQLERAQKTWALVVLVDPDSEPGLIEKVRSTLGIKRFELEELRARLPGPVRYGARVDLTPFLTQLREAGVAAELRRRSEDPGREGG